jgi:hypothetical protein
MRPGGDRDKSHAVAGGGAWVRAGTVSVRATAQGLDASSTGPLASSSPAVAARSPSNDGVLADNSYIVDHQMCTVGHEAWPDPAVGEWAEPDLDHAAELMRSVASDPAAAAARGARAASDLWARHDPVVVGPVLAEQVARIADWVGKVGT